MKILFSGHHNPHFFTITEYLEKAIRSLGHELVIFEDRQHGIPGRLRKRLPFLDRLGLKRINAKLLSLAEHPRPDMAIVTGGHRVSSETVKRLKERGIVCVLWTIDPPLNFQPLIDAAPFYDHVFCQGTEAVELLEKAGIGGARWLPMACDPDCHHPLDCSAADREKYGSDVVFVGSYYRERADLLERLTAFDLAIWGPGWECLEPGSPLRRCLRGAHTTPEEWLKIYNCSRIILATHYRDSQGRFPVYQASPRVFEALACGAFLLCDRQKDVLALFENGTDLVYFSDAADLADKIGYYLARAEVRKGIAAQGRRKVLENHTYVHRIESLLSGVGRLP
jgi:spore maturation protein CgeB